MKDSGMPWTVLGGQHFFAMVSENENDVRELYSAAERRKKKRANTGSLKRISSS